MALAHRLPDRRWRPGPWVGAVGHGQPTASLSDADRIRLEGCERPTAIDADVDGDLVGDAHLRFRPQEGGTSVEAFWEVEMRQPAMRLASRVGRPLLQWGHDRVVEMQIRNLPPLFGLPWGYLISEGETPCEQPSMCGKP